MIYSLDSNIIIAALARRNRSVMEKMVMMRDASVVSSIVRHELYFGVFNSERMTSNLANIDDLDLPIIDFDDGDARMAGLIRVDLKRRGTPIGPYDLLIAGQALARDLTLVTANIGEFGRVAGLRIENWIDA